MRRQLAILTAFAVVLTSLTGLSEMAAAETGPDRLNADKASFEAATVDAVDRLGRSPKDDGLGLGDEPRTYMIRLKSESVATYRGGKAGFEPTAVEGRSVDADSSEARAYRGELQREQANFIDRMEQAAQGRVDVKFQYDVIVNGMAVVMTPDDARRVAADPAVDEIHLEKQRELHTDEGPVWIDAHEVWDANGTLGLPADYKGEGMIIGIIDTGINPSNGSFADVGDDLFDHDNPLGAGTYLGVCDSGFEHYDPVYPCNDKLIGAYNFVAPGEPALDYDGHGSHTASTAGGNVVAGAELIVPTMVTNPTFDISGVAPHANIVAYLGCCSESGLTMSIQQAVLDGVDVINYSIGSSSPSNLWDDFDTVGFLEARAFNIHVATSNGNDGPGFATTGSPADAPWITSVGATTHPRFNGNAVIDFVRDDASPLTDIQGKGVTGPLASTSIVYAGDAGDPLCLDDAGHEAEFTGKIVVCDRGENGRVEKSENVAAQGAAGFVLANDEPSGDSLSGDIFAVPGLHITYDDGLTLKAWLAASAGHVAAIEGTVFDVADANADVMAGFSSRGPNRAIDVIVPDVTAPGVDIFAAYGHGGAEEPVDYTVEEWNMISGTSMASPHVAGALALLAEAHPTWTPAEVQSALMTTAFSDIIDSDGTDADPYDIGSGRVDVSNAILARLLFDESISNYEDADPDLGGDPKTLNLPSFANTQCLQVCSWDRTASYPTDFAGDGDITWTPSVVMQDEAIIDITITPSTDWTLSPGDSETFTVTVDVSGAPNGETLFGRIMLTPDVVSVPSVTMPIAVVPSTGVLPNLIDVETRRDAGSQVVPDLQAIEITEFTATIAGLTEGTKESSELEADPTPAEVYDDISQNDVYWVDVPAGAARFIAEVVSSEASDLDLWVGIDTDGEGDVDAGEEIAFSASGTALERVSLLEPDAGSYWIMIQNWTDDGVSSGLEAYEAVMAAVPDVDAGNAGMDGPAGTIPEAELFDGTFWWDLDNAMEGDYFYGVVDVGSSSGSPGDIGSIPVDLERFADDVTKTASVEAAAPAEQVTYDITVQPNIQRHDVDYTITDTIPEGMDLVPGTVTGGGVIDGDTIAWDVTMPTAFGVTGTWSEAVCAPVFGGYTDLIGFDIHPDPTLVGDTFVAQAFSDMGPFPFYNDEFSTVGVTDDGFLVMPGGYGGEPWVSQSIPDVALPNGVIAGLWADMEIAYADESSLGAGDEMGITLASLGDPGAGAVVFEYDNPFEFTLDDTVGPSVTDMQIWVWNYIDPVFPEIELYYDNIGDLPAAATIGVEDFGGENAFAVVNDADPAAAVAAAGATTGLCLDYEPAEFPPVTMSFTVVANGSEFGTLTNAVDHITDDPYAMTATATADVAAWQADFSWTPLNPAVGSTVTFDGSPSANYLTGLTTADDLTYSWDFDGDGTEDATSMTPTHTFATMGTHDVELTVTSTDLGTSHTRTKSVPIVEDLPPTADAGADKVVAVNTPVTLNGTGSDPNGGPVTYSWDPGDGSGALAGKTVEHTYTQAGQYTATLTVTDQGGLTATDTVEITVVPGDAADAVRRAFGLGREQTAIELSKAGWASADTVILAYSGDYPDALAAATLGAAVNAPVLQNGTDALADHNKAEIERLGASKIYVVSGPNAISEAVVEALEDMGLEVVRLSGATRFHTAAAIADEIVELDGTQDQVVVALGTFWADALSSGTLATTTGSPVLLANEDSVPDETIAAIKRVLNAGGKVWMVGGPATMSAEVEAQLFAEGFDVSRLAGADRFATNVVVLNEAVSQGANLGIAVVASGGNYPDALSAAVAAWKLGGFLILVHPDDLTLSPPSESFLVGHADDIHGALIAGGPNTIADLVVTQVAAAIE